MDRFSSVSNPSFDRGGAAFLPTVDNNTVDNKRTLGVASSSEEAKTKRAPALGPLGQTIPPKAPVERYAPAQQVHEILRGPA
jgi:hypothetical protein